MMSDKWTVFLEHSFKKQVLSNDKYMYPSIFLRQMDAFVFVILQMFFATRMVLKIR